MRVAVLVLDGVFDSGLSIVLDTLATANELADPHRAPPFDVQACGVRRAATTGRGLRLDLARAERIAPPDLAIVPGIGVTTRARLLARLAGDDVGAAGEVLRAWSQRGVQLAAACSGTFVLASAGILDGHRATTTWWLSPVFRELYPAVALDESQMVVPSGRAGQIVTAGAALAHVDLALWLVRQHSPALAHTVARYLVFDQRPSQASFVLPDHLAHADPLVERFAEWVRGHLADFTLAAAAAHVGASERTLERKIHAVLGKSPVAYLQDVRVELAVHRLRTTTATVDEIAEAVGYKDGVTLRNLLRRKTGRGVREHRNTRATPDC